MREDCAKSSYKVFDLAKYNCACPQCNARYFDRRLDPSWVEVAPCDKCRKERRKNREDFMACKRRVTPAQIRDFMVK